MKKSRFLRPLILVAAFALVGCGNSVGSSSDSKTEDAPESANAERPFPDRLAAFGNGYPNDGDPCRRLGESDATIDWLDDSAILVGCPSAESAAAVGGNVVAEVDGFTVISVPSGDANPGLSEIGEGGDALVAGTEYNATAQVRCGFDGAAPTSSCDAGVKRNWGPAGEHLVEITRPDGFKRAIYYEGATPVGANRADADGSAGWDFEASRDGDQVTVNFGPETYIIVDALVVGG